MIGISRGARNNFHALSDGKGRPFRFLLAAGHAADSRAAGVLLDEFAPRTIVPADKPATAMRSAT